MKPWEPETFVLSMEDVRECFYVISKYNPVWAKRLGDDKNIRQEVVNTTDKAIRKAMRG